MTKWREVRVFISSTFRDMHAERDYLVKVVFPQLRERLEPYRIRLIDIDLRWGITEEESENNRVLDLCLQQIDTCRPFFVGILGERYGWVPQSLNEQSISKYGWIQHHTGKSVTELEILYGVLNKPDMHTHAFFYFRDPAFANDIPEAIRPHVLPEDAASAEKLSQLKQAIRDAALPRPPMENYPCRYAGLRVNWRLASIDLDDADRSALKKVAEDGIVDPSEYTSLDEHHRDILNSCGTIALTNLEAFGARVFDDLWNVVKVEHKLPDRLPAETLRETDPLAEEEEFHRQFMESRTRIYIGRQEIQHKLHAVADADDPYGCVVTGPAGSGKSAVMAKFAQDYADRHPDQLVIPHFVGATPASTSLGQMLRRFCLVLTGRFQFTDTRMTEKDKPEEVPVEVPFETNKLISTFQNFVRRVPKDQRVVFVIDALNQLDETDNAHELHWLPREWPDNVNCFTSCISREDKDLPILTGFQGRRSYNIKVDALTDEERAAIISEVPSVSAKRLAPGQIRILMENPATRNPLFLLVALEELRGFGSYEQLNRRIEQFPREGDTVTAIFTQVIERLEEDYDQSVVRRVLAYLACARSGLSETELLELVEGIGAGTSTTNLFPILRQIRPYLQFRGEYLDFYHRSFYKAVQGRYLARDDDLCAFHTALAGYFHTKLNPAGAPDYSGDCAHGLRDLVWHQVHGARFDEAHDTLMKFRFVQAKVHTFDALNLIQDYDLLSPTRNDSIGLVRDSIRLSAHVLKEDPGQLASQMLGRLLDAESPKIQKLLSKTCRENVPWIRPLRRYLTAPGGQLIGTLTGHSDEIMCVALSPDGHIAVSGSKDSTMKVWDVNTGTELHTIRHHADAVTSVALTPNGKTAISTSWDGTLTVWDVNTGSELRSIQGQRGSIKSVALTADGRIAISSSNQAIQIWDTITGMELRFLNGHRSFHKSVALASDGRIAAYIDDDRTIMLLDVTTAGPLRSMQCDSDMLHCIAMTPDGRTAVSGSRIGTLQVWDINTGKELRCLTCHTGAIESIALTADGKTAVTASSDTTLGVWDLRTGTKLRSLEGHSHFVESVALTANGCIAISASRDRTLKVWDLNVDSDIQTTPGHADAVTSVALTPSGKTAISASRDKTLKVWDITIGKELRTLQGHSDWVNSVALTSDGRIAVSGSSDDSLKVWDLCSGEEIRSIRGHANSVESVAITPDGRMAVSGSQDYTVKVWNLTTGEELHSLDGRCWNFISVALAANRNIALSIRNSTDIQVWNLKTGAELQSRMGHTEPISSIALTLDGRTAISASSDKTLRVWDVDTSSILQTLKGHRHYVESVALTPDGRIAVSTSRDNTLKIWNVENAQVLSSFTTDVVLSAVAISDDGKTVVAGDSRGTLYILAIENIQAADISSTLTPKRKPIQTRDKLLRRATRRTTRTAIFAAVGCLAPSLIFAFLGIIMIRTSGLWWILGAPTILLALACAAGWFRLFLPRNK